MAQLEVWAKGENLAETSPLAYTQKKNVRNDGESGYRLLH